VTNASDHLSRALRTALPVALALCIAALLGLTPIQATAADPTSADRAPLESATAENPSATQETSVRQGTSARRDPSARQSVSGQRRSSAAGRDLTSERSSRGMSQSRGRQELVGRPLDLAAPPISHVMTREQVQTLLASEGPEVPEDVMVERGRYQAPVPQGQIRAIAWALVHPLQAWRIFTPITDQ